jgi:hypothetical protein
MMIERFARLVGWVVLLFAALAILAPGPALAAEPLARPPVSATVPLVVTTGIYVNQVHELNLKENNFVVEFFVWFRWRGEAKPNTTWTVINGRVESKSETTPTKVLPDGSNYSCWRVVAKITKYWDVSRYPLDKNTLTLAVEEDDGDETLVRYVSDVALSGIDPGLQMPGWTLSASKLQQNSGIYRSNFGDLSIPSDHESRYARVSMNLTLSRAGKIYFAKVFFGVWVAAAIAFLCFFIKPTNVDPRFGLGVGAIFAAIASEYSISSSLPESGIATLADRVHVLAYLAIFLTLAQSTVSLWLAEHGKEANSKRLDKVFAIALPTVYIAANILISVAS